MSESRYANANRPNTMKTTHNTANNELNTRHFINTKPSVTQSHHHVPRAADERSAWMGLFETRSLNPLGSRAE